MYSIERSDALYADSALAQRRRRAPHTPPKAGGVSAEAADRAAGASKAGGAAGRRCGGAGSHAIAASRAAAARNVLQLPARRAIAQKINFVPLRLPQQLNKMHFLYICRRA